MFVCDTFFTLDNPVSRRVTPPDAAVSAEQAEAGPHDFYTFFSHRGAKNLGKTDSLAKYTSSKYTVAAEWSLHHIYTARSARRKNGRKKRIWKSGGLTDAGWLGGFFVV